MAPCPSLSHAFFLEENRICKRGSSCHPNTAMPSSSTSSFSFAIAIVWKKNSEGVQNSEVPKSWRGICPFSLIQNDFMIVRIVCERRDSGSALKICLLKYQSITISTIVDYLVLEFNKVKKKTHQSSFVRCVGASFWESQLVSLSIDLSVRRP